MSDHDMLIAQEQQIKRLVADAESEKFTRKRSNEHIEDRFNRIHERLDQHARWFWMAFGGGAVVIFILQLWKP